MSAQTIVCQTARSGPLGRDIFLGPRGALPLVVAIRPEATRLRNSERLLLAGPLCPGPLGPAAVTDDRQTGSDARPLDQVVGLLLCCSRSHLDLSESPRSNCFASLYFQSVPAQYQQCNSRTSVQPRREGYLQKASSRVGARLLRVKRAPYRSVCGSLA